MHLQRWMKHSNTVLNQFDIFPALMDGNSDGKPRWPEKLVESARCQPTYAVRNIAGFAAARGVCAYHHLR